ncbi:hypothetical protein FKM82_025974 [Ascaphus truei]
MEIPGRCRFRCPLNFEPVAVRGASLTSDSDTEVWLIKAPADFVPERFDSRHLPLSGKKTLKVKVNGNRKFYGVTASPSCVIPCRALLPQGRESEGKISCSLPFEGMITIADTLEADSTLQPVPDKPPLMIPEGLKQRFLPFGADAPRGQQRLEEEQLAAVPARKKRGKKRKHER